MSNGSLRFVIGLTAAVLPVTGARWLFDLNIPLEVGLLWGMLIGILTERIEVPRAGGYRRPGPNAPPPPMPAGVIPDEPWPTTGGHSRSLRETALEGQLWEPGSANALLKGCRCSPVANNYGQGVPIAHGRVWEKAQDCPLHGTAAVVELHRVVNEEAG